MHSPRPSATALRCGRGRGRGSTDTGKHWSGSAAAVHQHRPLALRAVAREAAHVTAFAGKGWLALRPQSLSQISFSRDFRAVGADFIDPGTEGEQMG